MQNFMAPKQSTVIVINIDEAIRDFLEWLIQSAGHKVRTYDSGLGYLDDAVRDGRPDCVILDPHMPEISGFELYGIIKTQYPEAPITFVTGHADQIMTEKALTLEPQGFFTKPLDTNAI